MSDNTDTKIIPLNGMYEEYFLDYASYVILERAVPSIVDGLKPVQRRILYSLREKDDGRYHKVANIIGHTMQYHPHGDAAIGDALVNLGQKDLLIDPQGNWGDYRTGDRAAAPRYIEARLTKFALEVAFNGQTTEWQMSYDGRNKEPIDLPMKFPLVLAQGVEGIAVGLSTKIMPHNFIELIKASIRILEGKSFKIYPDFPMGGYVDVTDYNKGKRGGKIKVRAKVEILDKNSLIIRELPYGVTTENLMDSIVKANDKGKIKIKKVIDNTAKDVEIIVDLATGISPDVTIDALYAFTNCEVSISPNACVIVENKPHFLTVHEILEISTMNTKELLKRELEIKLGELQEKWHFSSLEKIFIENRIYRDIEECETWEAVIDAIQAGLKKYVATPSDNKGKGEKRLMLKRDITEEDIVRLTEIKIKRISKYNSFKADELMAKIEADIAEIEDHLANLTAFAIAYFERLLEKYGKGKERKTEITTFETIKRTMVIANNTKLYVNRKDGFVGQGLKKEEFVAECSDIDDIIVFRKDGKMMVTRIDDKTFVGKNIIHVAVWKKNDDRSTYNMIYVDAGTGKSYAKRFNIKSITRDKEYDLTKGVKGSRVHYFSYNANGESEVVKVTLSPTSTARKKIFEFDFSELAIKGRSSQGNTMTKYPIRSVVQTEVGKSTLGAQSWWLDDITGRLNKEERGIYLGDFDTGDNLIMIYSNGSYEICEPDPSRKFEPKTIKLATKYDPDCIVTAVYYDGEKKWTMVKRFFIETSKLATPYIFITEHNGSKLYHVTLDENPNISFTSKDKSGKSDQTIDLEQFIDVKGWKAIGNRLAEGTITNLKAKAGEVPDKLSTGDTVEFDVDDDDQPGLF